jgi:hypothetical protein
MTSDSGVLIDVEGDWIQRAGTEPAGVRRLTFV